MRLIIGVPPQFTQRHFVGEIWISSREGPQKTIVAALSYISLAVWTVPG